MSERVPPMEYDRVLDDEGNAGTVVKCRRPDGTGTFLSVRISSGPRYRVGTTTWGKLWQFRPLLDYEGGTLQNVCLECDRPFRATVELLMGRNYPRQDYCRTHARRGQTPAQREQERIAHAAGEQARKTAHHARPEIPTIEERTDVAAPVFIYRVSVDGTRAFYAGARSPERAQQIVVSATHLRLIITDRDGRVLFENRHARPVH